MNDIIIGNICSLCAMITDSISGTRRKHSEIMGIQIISQFFYAAGYTVLRGYSGVAQNIVAVLRNLAAMKNVKNKAIEWTLIGLGVVLGIWFNNRGLLGWLPIVANFEYSVSVFRFRDNEKALKYAFIINMVMFCVFNVIIYNFIGAASTLFVAGTTAVSLYREARGKGAADGSAADATGDVGGKNTVRKDSPAEDNQE